MGIKREVLFLIAVVIVLSFFVFSLDTTGSVTIDTSSQVVIRPDIVVLANNFNEFFL